MFRKFLIFATIISMGFAAAVFAFRYRNDIAPTDIPQNTQSTVPPQDYNSKPNSDTTEVNLAVPFILESPEGSWKGPWINACEEASMTMVENYYQGNTTVSNSDAQKFMEGLFAYEDAQYGSNANSDANRTVQIINNKTSYHGTIKLNPTIDDIKNELRAGHPVISLHYGFDLHNNNIPFAVHGSYYHMLVIKGFDDSKHAFITNDDGDKITGADHLYDYDQLMVSIHDYNTATHKTDGTPTVIFTSKN